MIKVTLIILFLCSLGVFIMYVIGGFKHAKEIDEANDPMNEEEPTESPFVENATYIFKKPSGDLVKNSQQTTIQFTRDEAVKYSKRYPYYKVQQYGGIDWFSSSTYFL